MNDVEQAGAAAHVTEPSGATAAPALLKPWLKPRLETGQVADRTEGASGAGTDAGHCLS